MRDLESLPISSGVKYLAKGYIDYADESIRERAIVSLYDGLKPVNRRILYTMKTQFKSGQYVKSMRVSGNTLALHPHGEGAVYKAAVPLTDNSNAYAFPFIDGTGIFGDVSTGRCAAAPRYTEMRLHENAKELFGEMNGIKMIPNFDATLMEPQFLPVSFPNVLVNATEGIAVGFSSKIPSFNFNDVITLCEEYIRDGECKTIIEPDFVTGGYYIKNNKELKKLMLGGKASLKLRGDVKVDGKFITITEVPYGKPVKALLKQINDKNIDGIKNAGDTSDFDRGTGLLIECSSKRVVNEVLYSLYKETDLQCYFHANMVTIHEGVPKLMGVWNIVQSWVDWRKEVLLKQYKLEQESLENEIRESRAFKALIDMTEIKNEFVTRIARDGRQSAIAWLKEQDGVLDVIPEDLFNFVSTRSVNAYHNGGNIVEKYTRLQTALMDVGKRIDDIDAELLRQFARLKSIYGSKMERRTKTTTVDYEFANKADEIKSDESPCFYTLKNNFIKKLNYADMTGDYEYQIQAKANSTLIAIDNRGNILRVYCSGLSYMSQYDLGEYLPKLLDVENTGDDYRILWMGLLDGGIKTILYTDGKIGFLDTSEWTSSTRQVRVLSNGVASEFADKIGAVIDGVPEVVMVVDNIGRLGFTYMSDVKQKNRKARTKVWNMRSDATLTSYAVCSVTDLILTIKNTENHIAPRIKNLEKAEDFNGESVQFYGMF